MRSVLRRRCGIAGSGGKGDDDDNTDDDNERIAYSNLVAYAMRLCTTVHVCEY